MTDKIMCENGIININLSEDFEYLILNCVGNGKECKLVLSDEAIDCLIEKLEECQMQMDTGY